MIYIAHPYSGKEENKQKVEKIIRMLSDIPNTYISPIHSFGFLYNDVSYERGMELCLELLSKCEAIVLCGDWKESRGCNIEYDYAKDNNIVIYENLDDYVKTTLNQLTKNFKF